MSPVMAEEKTITVWETAGPAAEEERYRRLHAMTDEEARIAFAQVLALWRPPEAPSSQTGLAELERLLARQSRGRS